MPQLAPIMWVSLFVFLWVTFFSWMVLNWFLSKKSFSVSSSEGFNLKKSFWSW